ncbi:MAG: glycerophosphodiester phosphodiesterase [Planctomycetaceae bacterium]|nr:glycerophosphodiester phosphodiesterase [Planctomycetaceae bacterium]
MAAKEPFVVIAHRGASGYLPEHTLEAKALAYGMGADYLEQDVVLTRDNVPVVLHDIHLDTISDVATKFPERARDNGRYYAIDFDLAEIRQLTASERFHQKTGKPVYPGRFPIRTGAFHIPTLAEEIEFIQGLNKSTGRTVGIYPELKQPAFHHNEGKDISTAVLKVLADHGYRSKADACYLQCFDAKENRRIREELGCQLKMVQLLNKEDWLTAADSAARERQLQKLAEFADAIGPNLSVLFKRNDAGQIVPTDVTELAHRHGLALHPWTLRADDVVQPFESFEQMHDAVLTAGIDGAFSDFPDQTLRLMGRAIRE